MSDAPAMGRIVTAKDGRVFKIGIDRPAKYNGFTPKMFTELAEAYQAYEDDAEAWCALVYAEGVNFTAGLQLSEFDIGAVDFFPETLVDPLGLRAPKRTKPLVMAVKGFCYTIGIELMLAADIVVAEEGTRFGQVEVKRGLMAFGGATIRMVERAGWGNAMKLLLTGDEFDAATALRYGFVQEVTTHGNVDQDAMEIAQRIAKQAPLAVRATRDNALTALHEGEAAAVARFKDQLTAIKGTEDFAEGVKSFVERRDGVFKGK
jgi:enoyl-CoA hydratase